MARPRKDGLSYFPHDCDASSDEKVEALRSLFGNDGYVFYFVMLERIYRMPNCELDVSDAETRQILARKVGVEPEKFERMINAALKVGVFSTAWYSKRKILSSEGIKKRAKVIWSKREKAREHYGGRVSDAETQSETRKNGGRTDTSKVKESKVKESKVKESKVKENKGKENKGKVFTAPSLEEVQSYFSEKGYSRDLATRAFEYYANQEPPWTDSRGKPVRSWKSKMIAVWFKEENKNNGSLAKTAGQGYAKRRDFTPEDLERYKD